MIKNAEKLKTELQTILAEMDRESYERWLREHSGVQDITLTRDEAVKAMWLTESL